MSKILIAFSGGPDSVYLYHYLKKQNHEIGICYVNHNVRKDIQNDIDFVKDFAIKENIFYCIESINLEKFNEDIARNKRYEILEKVREKNSFEYIATGHNQNDNVETIIFRIIRGTALEGLKGIPAKRGNIIRPILNISKEYILSYLNENNIKYLIDYTNFENDYSRNKIRNQILPIMKEINTNYLSNISNLIDLVNDVENKENREYIYKELKKYNIAVSSNKIYEILSIKNKNGTSIDLNEKYIWYSSYEFYGVLDRSKMKSNEFLYKINLNESQNVNGYEISLFEYSYIKKYLEKKEYKIYNIGSINKIFVTNRKNGDKLDNKKIKSIFINLKIDRLVRDIIPILKTSKEILSIADIKFSKKLNQKLEENSNYIVIKKDGKNGRK
ncbi:tRNA lysidine(34) synthetase TilS [Oceanivirga salmonicida]|uniref:tRNA lysidine(34) synthetase TilS n=1 Tax=Oceanivirga salmonicida TaxID=1769291 RepID=UPI00083177BC|nr:tRNA lysidine(34) synthetase TilS [Oceanivirga salmonicida]